jgi:hypothetical protein
MAIEDLMLTSTWFLPTHIEPSVTNSSGIWTITELRSRLVRVKLMVMSCLAMTIWFYLFCSLVYPNHLVCLYHFNHSVPSDLAVTAASLQTLGLALCQFSCTVMVPYEWVWILGSCLLSFNLRPFHNELVEGVRIPFFSLVLNPRWSSKMWIELFACLVFIAMASGSKEGESHVPLFWFYRA